MKSVCRIIVSSLACSMLSVGAAQAAAPASMHFGIKGGLMVIDVSDVDISHPFNLGVVVGGSWDNGLGIEAELTSTFFKGELKLTEDDVTMTTLAAYGVYRSPGALYVKGKTGLLIEDIKIGSASESNARISSGIGIGMRFSGGQRLEAEFTVIEGDVNVFSIGFNF